MTTPALGTIRVDFQANLAKFVSDLDKSSNKMERWGQSVSKAVKPIETSLKGLGTKMSLTITAPLAALAIAATRAADPMGEFAQSVERLGLQAQQSLRPLGETLIGLFERARPLIEGGVRVVLTFSQAFAALPDPVKYTVVGIGAFVAILGPLAFATSAVVGTVGALGSAYTQLSFATRTSWFVLKSLGAGMAPVGKSITGGLTVPLKAALPALAAVGTGLAVVLAAATGFSLGKYFYDEFKIVQQTGAQLVLNFTKAWENIKFVALAAFPAIAIEWDVQVGRMQLRIAELVQTAADAVRELPSWLGGGADAAGSLDRVASELQSAALTRAFNAGIDTRVAKLREARDAAIAFAEEVRDASLRSIEQDFGGKDRKGGSPLDAMAADLRRAKDIVAREFPVLGQAIDSTIGRLWNGVSGLRGTVASLTGAFQQLFVLAPLPFVQTRKEAEAAARALKALEDRAKAIRDEVRTPQEVFAQRLAEAKSLAAAGLIDDQTFQRAAAKWRKELGELEKKATETFGDKIAGAIEGFSSRASDAWADFVFEGKRSFDELASAFGRMLLSMATNELAFKPLFAALGQAIGGAAGGTSQNPSGNAVNFSGQVGSTSFAGVPRVRGSVPDRAMHESAYGGAGVSVVINDHRSGGAPAQVSEGRGPDGRRTITVLIRDEVRGMVADGSLDRVMGSSYGLSRRGGGR
jgi:hypothetical protein